MRCSYTRCASAIANQMVGDRVALILEQDRQVSVYELAQDDARLWIICDNRYHRVDTF